MFKNLLSREGIITTKDFFNPCFSNRFGEESIFQRGQTIHKYFWHEDLDLYISTSLFDEGAQDSWKKTEEQQQLEPKIIEFLAFLVPEEEYQLGLEIKDTK